MPHAIRRRQMEQIHRIDIRQVVDDFEPLMVLLPAITGQAVRTRMDEQPLLHPVYLCVISTCHHSVKRHLHDGANKSLIAESLTFTA
jgi:hypothetical protein